MSTSKLLMVALAATWLSACHVGPQIDETDLGRQPHGASVVVELAEKAKAKRIEHRGELLDVRDDGLVVLVSEVSEAGPRIVLIPWSKIHRASASELSGIAVRTSQGGNQRKASIEELRNVSRFPQGLSPELIERLLTRYGQTALDTIE